VTPHRPPRPTGAVAFGSNLGDRNAHISHALDRLRAVEGVVVRAVSDIIETRPVGPPGQGLYLNGCLTIDTDLPPHDLLSLLQTIESERGRERAREARWGPRTLDLDLLLLGDTVINEPGLTLPHPRLHERDFVLVPLAQIAPDLVHPTLDATITELRRRLHAEGSSS
jgi:2-amino-4-hydroxy-6-hydroxymethyldihydropteridine diphosphokinase